MPKPQPYNSKILDPNSFLTIDGERVGFEVIFYNKVSKLPIPIDNFVSLEIEENLNSPFVKGTLKVRNNNNHFDVLGSDNIEYKLNYSFLETGQNFIIINIKRKVKIKTYLLSVIDESNNIENNNKIKTFYVESIYLHMLRNNKAPFSTIELLNGDTTQLSDKDRGVEIDKAIEKVLKNNFDEGVINKEQWHKTSNKTNFTSNYSDTSLDSLNFLLDKALDDENNFLYLLQRDNRFNLVSIKSMYEDYLTNNYENNYGGNFLLTTEDAPTENIKTVNSVRVTDYNIYNENAKHTLENIINYKVINYNFNKKKFNLFSNDNTVESLTKYINTDLLNSSTRLNREENPKITDNTFYKSLYSTTSDSETARYEGRNIIFKNLINISTMLSFRSQGIYEINTGNFINVTYQANNKNRVTNKLNGGWFVVGYKHTFSQNSFGSEIVCTKFHELK